MTPAVPEEHDDLGDLVVLPHRVQRVVSLVPSLTESVAETDRSILVGATAWCTHPLDLDVTRVGGTKNPDLDAISSLRPDVILANEEENRPVDIATLRAAGIAVWVTDVRSIPQAFDSLDRMLRIACRLPRPDWLDAAERAWARPRQGPRRQALIPIWRRPWMALGRDTFAGDVLAHLGVDNVLAGHPDRYPHIRLPDAADAADLVVLPDEPYAFSPDDGPEAFPGLPSRCISGRHLTWYGPSLVEAPTVLSASLA